MREFTGEEPETKKLLNLGGLYHDDKRFHVTRGRLNLLDEEIKGFFAPSLRIVIGGLERAVTDNSPEMIFLVGGLAESKYVLTYLQTWAKERGIRIAKPDGAMSKAIANGALYRYQHSAVNVHIAGMHYGTETDVLFDSETMAGRAPFLNILGEWRVRGRYYPIVNKNERLRVGVVKKAEFHRRFGDGDNLNVEMDLVGYRGDKPPAFYMSPDLRTMVEEFIPLGIVKADLKAVFDPLPWETSPTCQKRFKKLSYEICLVFDEIELRACLKWRFNLLMGICIQKRIMTSAATVIYL
ncbi:hypothetical protein D9619_008605 [Psilocybe cf. subviscida]|uniref:Uncharacterized protein n=1 Tax=Psilocybe cf. subviscida TaxID=2480587 RepID=A0A8H5BAK7_9AGAR|nr:hypothetical protein D9619_008605 [Psilocybe cf. subviscida]